MDALKKFDSLSKIIAISSSDAHINNRLLQIAQYLCLKGVAPTISFYLLQHRDRQLTLRLAVDSGGGLRLPTPPGSYTQPTGNSLCKPLATRSANPLDPAEAKGNDLFRKKRPYGWSLPIADETRVYGVMALLHHEPFPVADETIQFLLIVCRQIALCLKSDIFKKQAHRKVSRLKFLHRIGARLNACENLQNVFSQLPDSSPEFFAHTASVLTISAADKIQQQIFDQGFKNATQRQAALNLSRQLAAQTRFTPYPAVVDQNSRPAPLYEHFFEHFSAHITIPLISRGIRLGTLEFFLDRNPESQKLLPLEKPDLELLEILAAHIAATLERTRTRLQLNAANQAAQLRTRQLTISHQMKNALLAADSPNTIIRLTLGALVSNEGFSCSPAIFLEYLEKEKIWCTRFYARTPQIKGEDNTCNFTDDSTPLKTLADHLLETTLNLPSRIEADLAKLKFNDLGMAPSRFQHVLSKQKPAIINARFVTALHPTLKRMLPASTIVVIPIPGKERLQGIILAKADRIKQQDLSYISLFTDAATLALDNTKLYQLLQNSLATLNSAQARLTQSEKLVALGEMATSIAHEIKNPLVSIGGFARRLHKLIPDQSREKNYSLVITKEIERLEEIVNNVLSFSRPETNQFTPHDINRLITETTALFTRELKKLGIELHLQLTPVRFPVECDGNQIKQVLINLVNNSIHAITASDHNSGGHHITIRTIPFCDLNKRDERALIEIEDNGSGIQEEVLHDIFNPFFTTKHDGTGLGLPICHRIILNHQGEIRVHNRINRGVKVVISLPSEHKIQPEPSV